MSTLRPFPGLRFRVETPLTVDLPRMDVAAFVGFASRGPLQVPVPVESYADFTDIFGGFYRLAWDGVNGVWQTACLAPAVQAFFAQGGRRCWIVRVASQSQAIVNEFPLTGLLQVGGSGYNPLVAQARSAGSWSDPLQVKVEPQVDRIAFFPTKVEMGRPFDLSLPQNQGLQTGDLLQLNFSDQRHLVFVAIVPNDRQNRQAGTTIQARADNAHWFCTVEGSLSGLVQMPGSPFSLPIEATITGELKQYFLTKTFNSFFKFWSDFWFYLLSKGLPFDLLILLLGSGFWLPQAGDWLLLETPERSRVWLLVQAVETHQIKLQGAWMEGCATAGALAISRVQRVQLALTVTQALGRSDTLQNLACTALHPRFIGHLPTDEARFAHPAGSSAGRSTAATALWSEIASPRFPLALTLGEGTTLLPLGLTADLPSRGTFPSAVLPLMRDGLVPETTDVEALSSADWTTFCPEVFLDPALRLTTLRSLLTESHDRLYLQGQALAGIHALVAIEEVSLIALPDATQRGWQLAQSQTLRSVETARPETLPDPCAKISPFHPCVVSPPTSGTPTSPSVTTGSKRTQWQLLPPLEYDAAGLLEVQQAAARLATARGDLVAILGFPKHYRLPETLAHQQQLLDQVRREGETIDSYMALYHPWLSSRAETGDLIQTDPTGSMVGVIAARSLLRGAWVAPANEPIQNILATMPSFGLIEEKALYAANINPIRQLAQGFVAWGSSTQSQDSDLSNLNVRRLLILLKRLALREGQLAVFAPHSPAFRRQVQQQFEQVLSRLFARGAFTGRVPTEAYQVVVDETLNTRNKIENGQFIVELRVAPSQPMTFITVRLVQSESNLLTVQEGRVNDR